MLPHGGQSVSQLHRLPVVDVSLTWLLRFSSQRRTRMLSEQSVPAAHCSAPCCKGGRCLKEKYLQRRRPCVVSFPSWTSILSKSTVESRMCEHNVVRMSGHYSAQEKYSIFMRHRYSSCVEMLLELLDHELHQIAVS